MSSSRGIETEEGQEIRKEGETDGDGNGHHDEKELTRQISGRVDNFE